MAWRIDLRSAGVQARHLRASGAAAASDLAMQRCAFSTVVTTSSDCSSVSRQFCSSRWWRSSRQRSSSSFWSALDSFHCPWRRMYRDFGATKGFPGEGPPLEHFGFVPVRNTRGEGEQEFLASESHPTQPTQAPEPLQAARRRIAAGICEVQRSLLRTEQGTRVVMADLVRSEGDIVPVGDGHDMPNERSRRCRCDKAYLVRKQVSGQNIYCSNCGKARKRGTKIWVCSANCLQTLCPTCKEARPHWQSDAGI
eukprot:10864239-Karenia_brevis.AAC.1